MVEIASPLGDALAPGSHGNLADDAGVTITELRPGSIVEVAAWPGTEAALLTAIKAATGLSLSAEPGSGAVKGEKSAFGIGPGRFLLVDAAEGLAAAIKAQLPVETGTVTDLSHGRTAIRIEGRQAGWVLAKLYAIDFSPAAFPVSAGKAAAHHDIATQMQRVGDDAFDLYVFRSFARSFGTVLGHAAEEVGYVVK